MFMNILIFCSYLSQLDHVNSFEFFFFFFGTKNVAGQVTYILLP